MVRLPSRLFLPARLPAALRASLGRKDCQ